MRWSKNSTTHGRDITEVFIYIYVFSIYIYISFYLPPFILNTPQNIHGLATKVVYTFGTILNGAVETGVVAKGFLIPQDGVEFIRILQEIRDLPKCSFPSFPVHLPLVQMGDLTC